MFFKYSLRELLNNPKFSLIFALNIALGLFGLTLVSFFGQSFNNMMASKSVSLLGADFAVRTRYAPNLDRMTDIESYLPKVTKKAHIKEFFTMTRNDQGESRLAMLSNLENGYPFYGGFIFGKESIETKNLTDDSAWVYPEILVQMNMTIGDTISIGEAKFKITGVITEDGRAGLQMGALAPRIYVSSEGMERSRLLQLGSTVSHGFYYQFEQPITDNALKEIVKNIQKDIHEQGIRYVTPVNASEQTGRSINYLNDFLGLVSLIALFMANVGIFFLYRTFLNGRKKDMAILKCLGLPFSKLSVNYYLHLVILGVIGTIMSIVLTIVCLPILYGLIRHYFGLELPLTFEIRPLIIVGLICLCSNILIGIPLIAPLKRRKISELFDELTGQDENRFVDKLYFIPWLIFFYFLSVYVCSSIKVGSIFFGAFLGLLVIVYPLGHLALNFLSKLTFPKNFIVGLVVRSLTRNKHSTLSFFLALTFASMLINLTPMLKVNVEDEFQTPKGIETPSLFLFDIQEEQVHGLKEIFNRHGLEMAQLSPMIRARFTKINGKAFEASQSDEFRTREDEQEERSRNRGLNLTYRDNLAPSERIIKGRPFENNEVPEASIEARYAERMKIKLGDMLEFDILGLPIEAKVTSIRRVRWTSFSPNFFVTLKPGLIDDAPKTFLATAPKTNPEIKRILEREVVEEYSNVSIINVEEVIKRVLGLVGQMGIALQSMAILSLAVGLMVLYSLVSHSLLARMHETGLLKLLGLKEKKLKKSLYVEYLGLSSLASLVGLGFSYLISYVLTVAVFDAYYTAIYTIPLAVFLGIQILVFLLVGVSSRKVVKRPVLDVFRELRV